MVVFGTIDAYVKFECKIRLPLTRYTRGLLENQVLSNYLLKSLNIIHLEQKKTVHRLLFTYHMLIAVQLNTLAQ